MRAGKLSSRIVIEQRVATQDAVGQPAETWSTVATVWAHIRILNGMEAIKADAETSITKASIRIRKRSGIDAGMRVSHAGAIYNIEAVLPDEERREHLDLVCERAA